MHTKTHHKRKKKSLRTPSLAQKTSFHNHFLTSFTRTKVKTQIY